MPTSRRKKCQSTVGLPRTWRQSSGTTRSIGVFRLWRDLGYAIGALLTGVLADLLGISWAIGAIGLLTLLSAAVIGVRMEPTR